MSQDKTPAPQSQMIDAAEANIRADHRAGKITKEQFQKEMLIVARARGQALGDTPPQQNLMARILAYLEGCDPNVTSGGERNSDLRDAVRKVLEASK